MLSTFAAFNFANENTWILGGPYGVVGLRVGLSFVVAFVTALVVDWQYAKFGNDLLHPSIRRGLVNADDEAPAVKRNWWESIDHITETALHDFIDIMAFLILGAALAVCGRAWMESHADNFDPAAMPAVSILILMAAAVLFCLCSEADAFVAANFPASFPPAAKLAFLVLGPMFDLKLLVMYTRVYRPKLIYTIIVCLVVQVFVYCLIVHYVSQSLNQEAN